MKNNLPTTKCTHFKRSTQESSEAPQSFTQRLRASPAESSRCPTGSASRVSVLRGTFAV